MRFSPSIIVVAILTVATCLSQTRTVDKSTDSPAVKLQRMPESLETRYALSAIPSRMRDNATVYLLDPDKGYVMSRNGTNGFSCIVVRSDWQFPTQKFRDDIFWPVCFDAEGSKTLLQDYLTTAELRAKGMDSKQVYDFLTKKFKTSDYTNPRRTGVAYMIEPIMRTFGSSDVPLTMNMPHYMFYAPNVKNSDIGGNPLGNYPFVLSMSPGRDDYIIMLVGEAEKAKIVEESKDLLNELCAYSKYLCTTEHA